MPKSHVKSNIPSRNHTLGHRRLDELIVSATNPNTHSLSQIKKIQRSMRTYGWTNPILIDDDGNVICGHGRLEAARLNGETHVPVINLGQMTEADRRAYIIADNRLAQDAQWSKKLLRSELSGLIELGYEVELTGFDTFEIDGILSIGEDEPEAEDNVELPADDAVPVSRLGDFWKIGDHWLLVDDARDPEAVERLLAGERAQLIVTDPPYGCAIQNNVSGNGKVKHDNFVMGAGEVSLAEFGMTLLRPWALSRRYPQQTTFLSQWTQGW